MSEREPERNESAEHTALVVERLTSIQGRLFAYIYSLMADPEGARDVLQETNRLLWAKAGGYDASREFLPWAMTHAFNQVRAARSKAKRERLVFQKDETLDRLSEAAAERVDSEPAGGDGRAVALEECLGKLTAKQRGLVERFYDKGEAMAEIAASQKRRENTVAVTLHRIRQSLAECIRGKLKTT